MFIETETTPNPNSLKFLPRRMVMENGTAEFTNQSEAMKKSPLAGSLLTIEGIEKVFFGKDFIAITKQETRQWEHLKPLILGIIMEHFVKDIPLFIEKDDKFFQDISEEFFEEKDTQTVQMIKEILETRVRPALAQDGGDVQFRAFKNNVVYLHMRGACAGCPSAHATLKQGIENLLRHFLPDVKSVEAIE